MLPSRWRVHHILCSKWRALCRRPVCVCACRDRADRERVCVLTSGAHLHCANHFIVNAIAQPPWLRRSQPQYYQQQHCTIILDTYFSSICAYIVYIVLAFFSECACGCVCVLSGWISTRNCDAMTRWRFGLFVRRCAVHLCTRRVYCTGH